MDHNVKYVAQKGQVIKPNTIKNNSLIRKQNKIISQNNDRIIKNNSRKGFGILKLIMICYVGLKDILIR